MCGRLIRGKGGFRPFGAVGALRPEFNRLKHPSKPRGDREENPQERVENEARGERCGGMGESEIGHGVTSLEKGGVCIAHAGAGGCQERGLPIHEKPAVFFAKLGGPVLLLDGGAGEKALFEVAGVNECAAAYRILLPAAGAAEEPRAHVGEVLGLRNRAVAFIGAGEDPTDIEANRAGGAALGDVAPEIDGRGGQGGFEKSGV